MDPFLIFTLILAALIMSSAAAVITGVCRHNDQAIGIGARVAFVSALALTLMTLFHFLPLP